MLRLMRMRWTVVGLAIAGMTAGCTIGGDGVPEPGRPGLAEFPGAAVVQHDAVVPENGTAPRAFIERERLPSCGSYAYTPEDGGPPEGMWRCLAHARDQGLAAEVIVQRPGIDSRGGVSYYRMKDGAMEVWQHSLTDQSWTRGRCGYLDVRRGPATCEATEVSDSAGE